MSTKPTYEELEQRVKELEQTEKALEDSESKNRAIIEALPELTFIVDEDGQYLEIYTRDEFNLVEPAEGLKNKYVADVLPQDVATQCLEAIKKSLETNATQVFNYTLSLGERVVHFYSRISALQTLYNNKPAVVWTAYDTTKQHELDDALKESERFFSQMFEQSIVSTQLIDKEGKCIRVNPIFCELFGVTPEDMMHYKIFEDEAIKQSDAYEPLLDVFNNKNSHRWRNSFNIALASESSGVKTMKPETVYLENLSYPILDEDGNLLHAVIQHHNITEQVETAQALKESEETYRNIFTNSQVGLFRTNPETGDVLDINDALARMVGFNSKEEILDNNLSVSDFYVDGNRRQEIAEKLIKTGSYTNEEALFLNHQKEYKWLRMSGILTDEGIIEGVAEDITEIKKAEKALKDSERKYRFLVDSIDGGLNLIDKEGKFLYVNGLASSVWGLEPEDMIGKTLRELLPDQKEFVDDSYKLLQTVTSTEKGHTGERYIKEVDAWVQESFQPVKNEVGDCFAIQILTTDITERKRAEEKIKASLKEKQTMIDEIHHRVKNNMNIISSLLKLQSNNIEDDRTKNILKDSQNRIFAMSAIHETIHGTENLSEVDLRNYLSKITTSVFQSSSVDPEKVKLNSNVDNSPISLNQAYPLGLIINELVSNSMKHAFPEEREGEITVSIKKLDKELKLIVADDGVGMPEDFDWKNSKSLGLKLVRTLVENQLDGSIDMESSNGAKFTIKFNIIT
jgi:PAS domain S-box-containing protein